MYPEMFSAFVDVAADFFPNAGNAAPRPAKCARTVLIMHLILGPRPP